MEVDIKKFKQHPSINLIKENVSNTTTFNFILVKADSIIKEINLLDNRKQVLLKMYPDAD